MEGRGRGEGGGGEIFAPSEETRGRYCKLHQCAAACVDVSVYRTETEPASVKTSAGVRASWVAFADISCSVCS